MKTHLLEVFSGAESAVVDLTGEVIEFCRSESDGLLSLFTPHSTCGLALMEVGSGSDQDLMSTLARALLPPAGGWRHRHGPRPRQHGGDHVMPALVSPSMVLPVLGGRPALGMWQSVVLVDPNRDNPVRKVRLSFVPG